MELTGVVNSILPEQSGQGKKGTWRKQDFVLEVQGTYPKKVCISMWGDKIDQWKIKEGEEVTASIDVESREYNGRWYTEVKAWKVTKGGAAPSNYSGNQGNTNSYAAARPASTETFSNSSFDQDNNDLPF